MNSMDKKGIIEGCSNCGCGYKCCSFGQEGHIVILPKELEGHEKEISHLHIIDNDYFGGKKARCEASNCKTCDNGYKPIMCRCYPLWVRNVRKEFVFRSKKCPLPVSSLFTHQKYVLDIFKAYKGVSEEKLDGFLSKAWIDRYEPVSPICLDGLGNAVEIIPMNASMLPEIGKREIKLGVPEEICARSEEEDIVRCLKSRCSYAASVNGVMSAYSLSYFTEYGTAYIDKCFVDETARGNGIQYILLNANIAALLANDVHEIYSMVSPLNKASLKSFTNAGFKVIRETKYKGYGRYILKWQL